MKRKILFASSILVTAGLLFLNGCKKDDTTSPVVTVTGDNPATVVLNGTYSDAGATATDDEDGTVTVTTSGSVDANTAGTYTITYSATDKAGNTGTATRTVNVVIQRSNYVWAGYTSDDSCTTNIAIGAFTYSGAISAGSAANAIIISNFSGTAQNCVATINGSTVTVASQSVGIFTVVGNGTMNATGTKITLDYTASAMSVTDSFHAVYTKQ